MWLLWTLKWIKEVVFKGTVVLRIDRFEEGLTLETAAFRIPVRPSIYIYQLRCITKFLHWTLIGSPRWLTTVIPLGLVSRDYAKVQTWKRREKRRKSKLELLIGCAWVKSVFQGVTFYNLQSLEVTWGTYFHKNFTPQCLWRRKATLVFARLNSIKLIYKDMKFKSNLIKTANSGRVAALQPPHHYNEITSCSSFIKGRQHT